MAITESEIQSVKQRFGIIGNAPMLNNAVRVAMQVAPTEMSVLITGESGSGKELVARSIHHYSQRSSKPWVDLSCAALPEHLVESELFGYEKGAFSGADSTKPGLFEMADKGTLFLDEIGELDLKLQAKLLRVLDGSGYFRLGGTKKIIVNVRIVCATNRDLEQMVREGKFREDLYHRLAQFHLVVPPLRQRVDDIIPIARLFLKQHSGDLHFMQDAENALRSYSWPGNVRELRNVVMKCSVMAMDDAIHALDLPEKLQDSYASLPPGQNDLKRLFMAVNGREYDFPEANIQPVEVEEDEDSRESPRGGILEGMERHLIQKILNQTGGHQERAAQLLGISRRTLSRKLKVYGEEGSLADDSVTARTL